MAEVVIPEGYGLAKLIWTMTGKSAPITTTWGYAAALSEPQDCADQIHDYCINDGSICDPALMMDSYTFVGVEVQQRVDGDLIGAAHTESLQGGYSGALPPINCSLLISKRTNLVGRKFRGRSYNPNMYFQESLIDQMGNLTSTAITQWQGQVDVFANGVLSLTPGFITGTAPFAVVLHSDATSPTPVTSMTAQLQMATQRRRMR